MKFDAAMTALLGKRRVTRKAWKGKINVVAHRYGAFQPPMLVATHIGNNNKADIETPYTPTQLDMFADDWEDLGPRYAQAEADDGQF